MFTTKKVLRWVHIGRNQWLRVDTVTAILPDEEGRGSEVWTEDGEDYRSPLPPGQLVQRMCAPEAGGESP